MKIQGKVRTSAKTDSVSFDEEKNLYIVSTKAPPVEGRANEAVIKLIAGYFKVPKSEITLKTGQKSKIKVFEIDR
ncbi:MAG: DUF167 domain-containing protein [Patescibacteria group bacterium]